MPFVDPQQQAFQDAIARAGALRQETSRMRGPQYAGRVLTVGESPIGKVAGAFASEYLRDKAEKGSQDLEQQRRVELADWLSKRPQDNDPQKTAAWAQTGTDVMHPLAREISESVLGQAVKEPYVASKFNREQTGRQQLASQKAAEAQAMQDQRLQSQSMLQKARLAEQARLQQQRLDSRLPKTQLAYGQDDTGRMVNLETGEVQELPNVARQPKGVGGGGSGGGGKPPSKWEVDKLTKLRDFENEYTSLDKTFKDDYAGYGAAGDLARRSAGTLGSWAPEGVQDANKWWSQYEMLVELPTRNAMFGSALTETEKGLWDQARQIKPGNDPKVVREMVQKMLSAVKRQKTEARNALKSAGKSADAVDYWAGEQPASAESPAEAAGGWINPDTGAEFEIGEVFRGKTYVGGDPNDAESWE